MEVLRRGRWAAVGALVVALFVLAGCGGGSDDSSSTAADSGSSTSSDSGSSSGPSKSEYIAQTDEVCAAAFKQANSLLTGSVGSGQGSKAEAIQRLILDLQPIVADAFTQLKDLPRPPADEDQLDAMYATADDELAAFAKSASDPEAAAAYAGKPFFPKFATASADYGMKRCAAATGSVAAF